MPARAPALPDATSRALPDTVRGAVSAVRARPQRHQRKNKTPATQLWATGASSFTPKRAYAFGAGLSNTA